jgi:hypothetical protein
MKTAKMKTSKLPTLIALGLVIGIGGVAGAQRRANETGTAGWDVNGQPGTTNQGGMAYGLQGIRIPLGHRIQNPSVRYHRSARRKPKDDLNRKLADHAFYPAGEW